jgi:hypothetical protein
MNISWLILENKLALIKMGLLLKMQPLSAIDFTK